MLDYVPPGQVLSIAGFSQEPARVQPSAPRAEPGIQFFWKRRPPAGIQDFSRREGGGGRPGNANFFHQPTAKNSAGAAVTELICRFLIGGAVVAAFALIGDLLYPKSFAGLFSAAPSVALATLGLTILGDGKTYASIEARSMIGGAIAFFVYSSMVSRVMMRRKTSALRTTVALVPAWLGCAFAFWFWWLR
jgi:hypothetical protein